MLRKENIICISSIDWDFVWQGHQEIMSAFAKNGNRVLFIENTGVRAPTFKDIPRLKKRFINWHKSIKGFKEDSENLYIYSPVLLPFPYSRMARLINKYLLIKALKRWMKAMEFYSPIIWTFLPTGTALDIINNIDKKLLVYYCIADFYELVDNPKKVKKTEDILIKRSDVIFVQGKVLEEKCRLLNNNVHIFPFGVNIGFFKGYQDDIDKAPEDIKNIRRPIIGYIGGIHKHIDFKLIRFIAENHPEWSIVLIGPLQTDTSEIKNFKNIFLLGQKDFPELPCYINEFDVGIIPYHKTSYTATVYPTKLNEYHALGKPVVSTDLAEVINFNAENNNLVMIGDSYDNFVDCISKALHSAKDERVIAQRISSAKKNSWVNRINEMSKFMEMALEKKANEPVEWKEKLIMIYEGLHRKALKITVWALSLYFLLFYTPLVWFLGSPLKISEAPQKADCILVFAGGVGESGRAGQGYEERVEYAVELYKKGYADRLIFSSGYTYFFKEPLVMKSLAISLGVPQDKIILEDKAKNTYENVNFSKEILNKNNWKKILLISSPYHMLRASLVINKNAAEIKAIYTPILRSVFYNYNLDSGQKRKIFKKQIEIQQIKGILHEYLGIIYYYFKGYI